MTIDFTSGSRSKHGHEIDFAVAPRGKPLVTLECKRSADDFDARNLQAFRNRYPEGPNFLVAADVERTFRKTYGDLVVFHVGLAGLNEKLSELGIATLAPLKSRSTQAAAALCAVLALAGNRDAKVPIARGPEQCSRSTAKKPAAPFSSPATRRRSSAAA